MVTFIREVNHCNSCKRHTEEYDVRCKCSCRHCQLANWGYTDAIIGKDAS